MVVDGQLVIVDAPCSGVQMAWLAYFAACTVAAFAPRPDAALARRLPLVGLAVLAGNVARNTLLVALEASPGGLSPYWHEAIGLGMVLAVVILVVRIVAPRRAFPGAPR